MIKKIYLYIIILIINLGGINVTLAMIRNHNDSEYHNYLRHMRREYEDDRDYRYYFRHSYDRDMISPHGYYNSSDEYSEHEDNEKDTKMVAEIAYKNFTLLEVPSKLSDSKKYKSILSSSIERNKLLAKIYPKLLSSILIELQFFGINYDCTQIIKAYYEDERNISDFLKMIMNGTIKEFHLTDNELRLSEDIIKIQTRIRETSNELGLPSPPSEFFSTQTYKTHYLEGIFSLPDYCCKRPSNDALQEPIKFVYI